MTRTFLVAHDNPSRAQVCERAIQHMRDCYAARQDFEILFREPRRTVDANACMWGTLGDIAAQVPWPHTRKGLWVVDTMKGESWKHVLTAAFEEVTEMAQGVEGGTVMLGARTSQYSRRKMGDFIESVHAFGSERGVKWSPAASDELAQWAPAERRVAA